MFKAVMISPLPPQKTGLDNPELVAPLDVAAIVAAASNLPAANAFSWAFITDLGPSAHSERLHLLHQVFLI